MGKAGIMKTHLPSCKPDLRLAPVMVILMHSAVNPSNLCVCAVGESFGFIDVGPEVISCLEKSDQEHLQGTWDT